MKANVLNLYKHYCEMVENPKGVDGLERAMCRKNAMAAKANLEMKFKTSPKYLKDPQFQAILEIEKPKSSKKKEESDGKE